MGRPLLSSFGLCLLISRAAIHFDAIKAAIASGLPDSVALKSVSGAPSHPAWISWLKGHPEKRAEIEALRHGRATPAMDRIAAGFEKILRLIEAGADAAEAGKVVGFTYQKLHDYIRDKPDLRAKYVAAVKKRERGPNRRGTKISVAPKRKRFTAEQFDEAVSFIRSHRAIGLEAALWRENLPSTLTMYHRATRNPEFRKRFYNAMSHHAAMNAHLYIFQGSAEPSLLLMAAMKDELFAAAWRRFKGWDPAARDDMIGETILAVLEGRIEKSDINKSLPALRRRAFGSRIQSLDAPAYEDSRDSLGDTLASPCLIEHY